MNLPSSYLFIQKFQKQSYIVMYHVTFMYTNYVKIVIIVFSITTHCQPILHKIKVDKKTHKFQPDKSTLN